MKISRPGLGLITAALFSATATIAYAEPAEREGVIISRSGTTLQVRTREGPLSVDVSQATRIRETSGLSRRTRGPETLIPGLIIKVEGDQQGSTITAEEIRYSERDWRQAISTRAGTTEQFAQQQAELERAAAERAELRQAIIDGQEYEVREEAVVYFATGSSTIAPRFQQDLRNLAGRAGSHGNYRVSILGYTDPVGNPAANERLSLRRAMAVSNYLRQTGLIQPGRVLSPSAMGEGALAPGETAPASNDEARRVVVRIVTPKGQLQAQPQQ
jgi:outer membrane protein OmpA-like peptidoglycan-associated protein